METGKNNSINFSAYNIRVLFCDLSRIFNVKLLSIVNSPYFYKYILFELLSYLSLIRFVLHSQRNPRKQSDRRRNNLPKNILDILTDRNDN